MASIPIAFLLSDSKTRHATARMYVLLCSSDMMLPPDGFG